MKKGKKAAKSEPARAPRPPSGESAAPLPRIPPGRTATGPAPPPPPAPKQSSRISSLSRVQASPGADEKEELERLRKRIQQLEQNSQANPYASLPAISNQANYELPISLDGLENNVVEESGPLTDIGLRRIPATSTSNREESGPLTDTLRRIPARSTSNRAESGPLIEGPRRLPVASTRNIVRISSADLRESANRLAPVNKDLGYDELFSSFDVKTHYPLDRFEMLFKSEYKSISSLDLSGIEQLTDLFFYKLATQASLTNTFRTSTVKCIGCVHLSDKAVKWMAAAFPKLEEVSLFGCPQITERSVNYLQSGCKRLTTLDVRATSVSVVPNYDHNATITTSSCPIFSQAENDPMAEEMRRLRVKSGKKVRISKLKPVQTYKVVIIDTENQEAMLLSCLTKEMPASPLSAPVAAKTGITIKPGDVTCNIIECPQSCCDIFIGDRTTYILVFNAKNNFEKELASLLDKLTQILIKAPTAVFLIGFIKSETVTSGVVKGEVQKAITNLRSQIKSHLEKVMGSLNSVDFADQQFLSHQALVLDSLEEFEQRQITYADIPDIQSEKAGIALQTALAASLQKVESLHPEHTAFSQDFLDYQSLVQKSPLLKKCIKEEQLITEMQLNQPAHISHNAHSRAINIMNDLGSLVRVSNEGGNYLLSLEFCASLLSAVITAKPRSTEKYTHVAEGTPMWNQDTLQELLESLQKKEPSDQEIDMNVAMKTLSEFLGSVNIVQPETSTKQSPDKSVATSTSDGRPIMLLLKETAPVSLDHYMKKSSANQEVEMVEVCHFLHTTPHSFFRRLSGEICRVWAPDLLWASGVYIQDGTVQISITLNKDGTVEVTGRGSVADSVKYSVALCKLFIEQTVTQTGSCHYFKPKEEKNIDVKSKLPDVGAIPHHSRLISQDGGTICGHCGSQASLLANIWMYYSSLRPTFNNQMRGMGMSSQMTRVGNIYRPAESEALVQLCAMSTMDFASFDVIIVNDLESFQLGVENSGPYCQVLIDVYTGTALVFQDQQRVTLPRKAQIGDRFTVSLNEHEPETFQLRVTCNGTLWWSANISATRGSYYPYVKAMRAQGRFILDCHQMPVWDMTITGLWKVGMKLEAKDILNPSLICVSTIDDTRPGEVLVHFDGWTRKYDYWSKTNAPELHPIGYCAQNGVALQKPKNYKGRFTWEQYFKETNTTPVPYEYFNVDQISGTPKHPYEVENVKLDTDSTDIKGFGCEIVKNRSAVWERVILKRMSELCDVHSRHSSPRWMVVLPSAEEMLKVNMLYPVRETVTAFKNHATYFVCPDDSHFVNFLGNATSVDEFLVNQKDSALMSLIFLQSVILLNQEIDYLGYIENSPLFKELETHRLKPLSNSRIFSLSPVIIPTAYNNLFPKLDKMSLDKVEAGVRRMLCMTVLELYRLMEIDFVSDTGFSNFISLLGKANEKVVQQWDFAVSKNVDIGNAMVPLDAESSDVALHRAVCTAHKLLYSLHKSQIGVATKGEAPKLNVFPVHIFRFYSHFITRLTICNQHLPSVPDDFFKMFPRLIKLDLSGNKLKVIPLSGLEECVNLTDINLSANKLTSLPEGMECIANRLIHLDISQNALKELPQFIFKLSKLVKLKASDLCIKDLPESIGNLVNLEELDLGGHMIHNVPDNLSKLQKLTYLNFSGVKWLSGDINSLITQNFFHTFIDAHPQFGNMTPEEKTELFNSGLDGRKDVLSNEEREKLNITLFKMFPRFLSTATDDTSGGFPVQILNFPNLKRLEFCYQGISKVPSEIEKLSNLQHIDLSYNPVLETLPAELGNLPLEDIHLKGCPSMKTPPKEIVARGLKSVMGYLKRLLKGAVECRRTKLMFVGLGGAGKTSLSRALMNKGRAHSNTKTEKITDGIDITEWKVGVAEAYQSDPYYDSDDDDYDSDEDEAEEATGYSSGDTLTYSVWDFAGQTVYYNTHQFFLSNRAVYMLLWNMRLGYEHAGLDFWLGSIACHAPKAPVLIVGSHKDQVEKFELPMMEMKARFPQICGFFFVSSFTGEGIGSLGKSLIKITLKEKYMGEKIPEAWLTLEKSILEERKEHNLLPFERIQLLALDNGIVDKAETGQAVQFLHNLGTLQYFQNDFLKDRVCINPQWIIDVMKCIVSVHKNPIENGKLYHKDLDAIWSSYGSDLHPWLLRLTEEFDLSFSVPEENASLVPCMLPEKQPFFDWPNVSDRPGMRETKMTYKFEYLPAGLFNRAQARLYQVSDTALVWKKGSYMTKNGNMALMTSNRDNQLAVKVQGARPENILFVIHEVIEGLITESFFGVHYDYFIPCSDCIRIGTYDPCMFSGEKIRRASELKASFLQCDKYFHILSLTDLHAIKPPDTGADFDVHLERTMQDLNELKEDMSTDVFMFYNANDVPRPGEEDMKVHPADIKDDLIKAGYSVWFPNDPSNVNVDQIALEMKEAKIIMVCISENFVNDVKCSHVFHFAKNVLQKTIQLVAVCQNRDWLKSDIGILVSSDVYCNMNHKSRYMNKMQELLESVSKKLGRNTMDQAQDEFPECFISYSWSNSHAAIKMGSKETEGALGWADPRSFKPYLEERGIRCWMDIERVGQSGLFEDIAKGLRHAKVVVACVSDQYAASKNCLMELRFALTSLNIPVILAVVGTGYGWEASEVGMLSLGCTKVSFQIENHTAYEQLFQAVKDRMPTLEHVPENQPKVKTDDRQVAFQELLELAQRKFLRQVITYTEDLESIPYPRLMITDYMTVEEKQAVLDAEREEQERRRREQDDELKKLYEMDKSDQSSKSQDADDDDDEGGVKGTDNQDKTEDNKPTTNGINESDKPMTNGINESADLTDNEKPSESEDSKENNDDGEKDEVEDDDQVTDEMEKSGGTSAAKVFKRTAMLRRQASSFFSTPGAATGGLGDVAADWQCFRLLCEYEGGWHTCSEPLPLRYCSVKDIDSKIFNSLAPYLARINAIMKHSKEPLALNSSDVGRNYVKLLEERCGTSSEFKDEYLQLRSAVMDTDKVKAMGELSRCHLPSGKTLWLCRKHQEAYGRVTVLSIDEADTAHVDSQDDNKLLAAHIQQMKAQGQANNRPKSARPKSAAGKKEKTAAQKKIEARGKLIGAGTAAGVASSYAAATKAESSKACRLM